MSRGGDPWARTLRPAQRATVTRIRNGKIGTIHYDMLGGDGWSVYMVGTIGPPKYLELRHRRGDGRVARWVIEPDGSVSEEIPA